MTRARLATLTLLALVTAPQVARGNGRFPTTVGVHFKPGDHQVLAEAVTWGLFISKDGGQTWFWTCEEAVGFGGVYDPDYAFTRTGALLATTTSYDGLRITRDLCHYEPAAPPLGLESPSTDNPSTFVAQIEVGPDDRIYAAASTPTNSQIYLSTDDAVSWSVLSNPGDGVDWWESLAVAPTLLDGGNTRLYLTGYDFEAGTNNKLRLLFRSDDSGVTWTPLPITAFTFGGNLSDLQIAAVSPTDPDLVFARVLKANGESIGDDIYRSGDAGAHWTRVFQSGDNVTAVVPRTSGDVVLATSLSGIHVSTDGGATFGAPVDPITKINCMAERDDGVLFACGISYAPDLMALGTATQVEQWTPMLTFDKLCAPVSCPHDTTQWDVCESQRWPGTVQQYGIVPPASCPAVVTTPDAGPDDTTVPEPGCCSAGSPAEALLLGVLVALPLTRRRRRKC